MPPLAAIVSLLPVSWQDKAKSIVGVLGSLLGVLSLVVDGSPKWLTVAVTVATALGVYAVPNLGYDDPRKA